MKKQSERTEGAGQQLSFTLEFAALQPTNSSSSVAVLVARETTEPVVLDLTPLLKKRDVQHDRSLLRAVSNRAAHLSGFLRKQP
jgi:hypothetical protein